MSAMSLDNSQRSKTGRRITPEMMSCDVIKDGFDQQGGCSASLPAEIRTLPQGCLPDMDTE